MSQISSADATKFCEDILRQGIRYNVEHHILPSENLVAERLLDRGVELVGAYAELCEKLANRPGAVKLFLGTLLSTAAFWKPSDISKAREGRKRLGKVNEEIAYHAARLGHLIAERDELHNHSRFASDTHFHVCEIIAAAAEDNYLFKVHVQERLDALHS
ncbi:hypothetical protein [Sphingopyxis sp. NFH-91]|uniref:hypothetical protein n=1 Tax=Sphingopyxis sp. NFH-91 TaxID=2744457 RepID=UPI001F30AE97|nr:hypothetical protein [Sphingopyxis sp. NFH-91]